MHDMSSDANNEQTWETFHERNARRDGPLVIAHRGTPQELPENTLSSFSRALQEGSDVLETDLRVTKDGQFVLIHDESVDRTTNGSGLVGELLLAEIKTLRTASPLGGYTKYAVPTLIELLTMTQGRTPLLLELKDPRFRERLLAKQLVDVLIAYEMLNKSAIVSFNSELVQSVNRVCPQIPTGLITLKRLLPQQNTMLLGPAWPLLFANPAYVAWAHRMGSIVAPLDTAPDKRMWYYLWLGVDAVLTNTPAQTVDAIRRRKGKR